MNCDCSNRLDYYEPHPDDEFYDFKESVELVDRNQNYWLCRCPSCSQLYAVEALSRGPLVVKIFDIEQFESFDEIPYRKKLFINFYGGVSNECCIQRGCENAAIKGLVFCVEHAMEWET